MELRRFLAVIQARLWLILLGTLVTAAAAFWISRTTTPIYQATSVLLVKQGVVDPSSDSWNALLASQRSIKTYMQLIKSPLFLSQAISELDLSISSGQLAGKVSVGEIRDTQLLELSAEDANPALAQELANRIAEIFIEKNTAQQMAEFDAVIQTQHGELADLEAQIKKARSALSAMGDPSDPRLPMMGEFDRAEWGRLQSELTQSEAKYTILLRSAEDFRLRVARYAQTVSLASPAELPRAPVRPNVPMNTSLATIAGLLAFVGLAFFLEYMDDTVKTADDVERVMGLPTLGNVLRVPQESSDGTGVMTADEPRSGVAEAFKVLRTNIEFSAAHESVRLLLVTSSSPEEGKTFTVANLGAAVAQSGKRVILVDSDLRRPSLHRTLGLANEQGLTSMLVAGDFDQNSFLIDTDIEGLRVLTSGPIPPNPSELLGSQRMRQLLKWLSDQADLVILDSPPTLALADASILATVTDGTLLVIEAGSVRSDIALSTKETLAKVGRVLGVSLNKLQPRGASGYYYYYYHRYYYGDEEDGNQARRRRLRLPWWRRLLRR